MNQMIQSIRPQCPSLNMQKAKDGGDLSTIARGVHFPMDPFWFRFSPLHFFALECFALCKSCLRFHLHPIFQQKQAQLRWHSVDIQGALVTTAFTQYCKLFAQPMKDQRSCSAAIKINIKHILQFNGKYLCVCVPMWKYVCVCVCWWGKNNCT